MFWKMELVAAVCEKLSQSFQFLTEQQRSALDEAASRISAVVLDIVCPPAGVSSANNRYGGRCRHRRRWNYRNYGRLFAVPRREKIVLLEAGRILNGTTGHTTAKITAQHDLIYDEFISHFGEDKARMYYEANLDAMKFIRGTIAEESIDCDLADEPAYIYTESDLAVENLENELRAYEKLGIPGELTDHISLPLEVKAALLMPNQARFHPLSYLMALTKKAVEAGAQILSLRRR